MERRKLTEEEINERLAGLEEWSVESGKLKRRFSFRNFAESLDFVNKVGALAEEADHHPDITFGWGYAEFEITTHDRGGLTDLDFDLAAKINDI